MYGGARHILSEEFAVLPLLLVLPLLAWWMRRGRASLGRVALASTLACYAGVLIGLTFFPLPLPPYEVDPLSGTSYLAWPAPWAAIVPLGAIVPALGMGFEWPAARYLVGNVVAFMPLGFIVPFLRPWWDGWRRATLLGLLVSGGIELTQLGLSLAMGFPFRVADVDDLLLNTLGTVLGYLALVVLRGLLAGRRRAR